MTDGLNFRSQYAQTGPCSARSQRRVSAYAERWVGVDVSRADAACDQSGVPCPEPRPRRERPFRFGFAGSGALWLTVLRRFGASVCLLAARAEPAGRDGCRDGFLAADSDDPDRLPRLGRPPLCPPPEPRSCRGWAGSSRYGESSDERGTLVCSGGSVGASFGSISLQDTVEPQGGR